MSEHVPIGDIEKPDDQKKTSLSATSDDEPMEIEPTKQTEIYSDMRRTRTGIQNSELVWGDRTWGMKHHPRGKPQDLGH